MICYNAVIILDTNYAYADSLLAKLVLLALSNNTTVKEQ